MYICFIIATMMLAASPEVRAADSGSPDRKVIVVRADPRTGKLVRRVVSSPDKTPGTPALRHGAGRSLGSAISQIVERAAKAHDVDPLLVDSIISVESNYDPSALSPKGAEGLMQLMPSTARMLGVSNSFDPKENIEAGVKYLKQLQSVYKDDRLALAAYNAGPGAVQKYRQVPPYRETQNYVDQVGKRYSDAKAAVAQKQAPAKPAEAAAPPVPEHPKLEQFIDENGRLYLRTR